MGARCDAGATASPRAAIAAESAGAAQAVEEVDRSIEREDEAITALRINIKRVFRTSLGAG